MGTALAQEGGGWRLRIPRFTPAYLRGDGPLRQRILVVDDEEPIRFALEAYFTDQGYDVDCAGELDQAEALLAERSYAALIADVRLTGIDGTEGLSLAATARAQRPETCVVLLTAHGSHEVVAAARQLRVHAFLHKPKPLAEVAQIVTGLLATGPTHTR